MNNSQIATTTRTPNLARNMAIDLLVQLPDVQDSLFKATSLTARDLAKAVLVSRLWYQAVTPFLWRKFFVAKRSYNRWPRLKEGFIANSKWIKAIYLDSPKMLTLLEEVWADRNCSGSNIPGQEQSSLEHFTVIITEENTHYVESVARLLLEKMILLTLKEFCCCSVFGNWTLIPEMVTGFIQHPPRLTLLKLERADLQDEDCLSAILNHLATTLVHLTLSECILSRNTFTKVKQPLLQLTSLFWKDRPFFNENFIFAVQVFQDVMKVAVNLVDFEFRSQYYHLVQAQPEKARRPQGKSGLGSLKRLKFEAPDDCALRDQGVVDLLNDLPLTLESLELGRVIFYDSPNPALCCRLGALANLTTLKLADCLGVSTSSWQAILTSCEKLVELDGGYNSPMHSTCMTKQVNGNGGTEGDHSHRWICHGLETLIMNFMVGSSTEDISGQDHDSAISITLIHSQLEALFEQLSTLFRLKKLELTFTGYISKSFESFMGDDNPWEYGTTKSGHGDQNVTKIHNNDCQGNQKDFLSIWQSLISCWQIQKVHMDFQDFPFSFWLGPDGSSYDGEKLEHHGREMWRHLSNIRVRIACLDFV